MATIELSSSPGSGNGAALVKTPDGCAVAAAANINPDTKASAVRALFADNRFMMPLDDGPDPARCRGLHGGGSTHRRYNDAARRPPQSTRALSIPRGCLRQKIAARPANAAVAPLRALAQAGDGSALPHTWQVTVDVIVIGSGFAGGAARASAL